MMASPEGDTHYENGARKPPPKRKRETPASRAAASRTSTPNAFSRRSPPREPAPIDEDEGERSPPRKLKRPGARATAGKDAAEELRRQREEQQRRDVANRPAVEVVADHYNAVPERGREWRNTESRIKGLRSLNNWIKSTLIQKFSRPEMNSENMFVLDMACGKGGDLGKWEKAPRKPTLYVGCDIADVSIEQARQRYNENQRRSGGGRNRRPVQQMDAQFYVHDAFGRPLSDIAVINQVGFDPNSGPGPMIIQGRMMKGGNFDVVSMMFALHYSFESEAQARGMLKNVAGALKKGGKFIGVMPNADVISAKVRELLSQEEPGKTPGKTPNEKDEKPADESKEEGEEDDWNPEKPSEPVGGKAEDEDDDWDPEKPSDPQPATTNDDQSNTADDGDDWDPERPTEPVSTNEPSMTEPTPKVNDTPTQQSSFTPSSMIGPPLEWGNSIYTVRFPRTQPLTQRPLPRDGVFRPPFGWKYNYSLAEAVDAPEYVVPFEAFRALAEEYGLELMYGKGFREVYEDESEDRELGMLAERMGVRSRDRSAGRDGLLVSDEEMDAAAFYHAFCFYKTF